MKNRSKLRVFTGIALTVFCLSFTMMAAEGLSADQIVKVGAPLPLTGPLAPEGKKQQQGYDLWADQANQKGGIKVGGDHYTVEMVYHDYQSKTPRAVQLAEKLITDDKVNFLFSPFGSGATKASSGVSEKYGIPAIAPTASSVAVYDQGYKFLFGTFTPNQTLTDPMTAIVKQHVKGAKKVAILARNDLFPMAIAKVMKASAEKQGFQEAFFGTYAIGTMDHASALTQIRAAQPDFFFATGYVNDLILIRQQMGDLGLRAPAVGMVAGPAYKEYVEACGPLAENVLSASWWHPAVRYTGQDVFGSTANYNTLFESKYGYVPDYVQASASACGVILQLAIEKAGTIDPKKVRDAMASLDARTFFGPVRFGQNGQINSLKPPVFQIQKGVQKVIYPDEIKQAEFQVGVK